MHCLDGVRDARHAHHQQRASMRNRGPRHGPHPPRHRNDVARDRLRDGRRNGLRVEFRDRDQPPDESDERHQQPPPKSAAGAGPRIVAHVDVAPRSHRANDLRAQCVGRGLRNESGLERHGRRWGQRRSRHRFERRNEWRGMHRRPPRWCAPRRKHRRRQRRFAPRRCDGHTMRRERRWPRRRARSTPCRLHRHELRSVARTLGHARESIGVGFAPRHPTFRMPQSNVRVGVRRAETIRVPNRIWRGCAADPREPPHARRDGVAQSIEHSRGVESFTVIPGPRMVLYGPAYSAVHPHGTHA